MIILEETSIDRLLLFVVTLLAVAANLPETFALQYLVDQDYFVIALIVVVGFSLLRYVRFALVLVTTVLVIGANLPQALASEWNINPNIMLITLVSIVVFVGANKYLKLVPDELEVDDRATSIHGTKALFSAVAKGKVVMLQRLIRSGVDVNAVTVSGKTPLMLAAYLGYPDVVQMLLTANAEVAVMDKVGNTALNIAQRKGFSRVTDLLKIASDV